MTILFKGISVGFSDYGQGNAVVFLHGFLENKAIWEPFITPLVQKGRRIVTIDLLGHGQTGCVGYVHTMEDHAQLVKVVLDNLLITKAVFIGHSMGGYVSLAIAELFPGIVKGIILVNSTASPDSAQRKENRERAIVAVKQNPSTFVRMAVGNLFSAANRVKLQQEVEKIQQEALKTPKQGIIASLEGMKIRKDRSYILKNKALPALLVLGMQDEIISFDENAEKAKALEIDTLIFPDGHMSFIENTIELQGAITDFIDKTT